MVLSIKALAASSGNYYLSLAREDYYLEGGEPPGQWLGEGAESLGLRGQVESEAFRIILEGYHPHQDQKLVQNAGRENRSPGYDLTFSAPKSVSVIWSQADSEIRQAIQQAQGVAVKKTLQYLEAHAATTRRDRHGLEKDKVGLIVASFEHSTSRAGDPQLHTHALVMNLGMRSDGGSGALEGRRLYQHKMVAGALYRAELAHQLRQRLSLQATKVQSWFEVRGVSPALMQVFSKRREAITASLAEKGLTSAEAAAIAALDTRQAKQEFSRAQLFQDWQTTGVEQGWSTPEVKTLIQTPVPRQQEMPQKIAVEAVQGLTVQNSTFTEMDLIRAMAERAPESGLSAERILKQASSTLQSAAVVRLTREAEEPRYTTPEILALEKEMLQRVAMTERDHRYQVKPTHYQRAVAERPTLSTEQQEAVEYLTRTAEQIKVIKGKAGTGKTFMLQAACSAWEKDGRMVLGAALSGKAAKGLADETQIPCQTLHRLIQDLEQEKLQLSQKTVVLIDEAGMVGTRQMAMLVKHVHQRQAQLVLVGDEGQLQSVEAGGAFPAIAEISGYRKLTEIRRQQQEWDRQSVQRFSRGEVAAALAEYAKRQQLHLSSNRRQAMERLIQDWKVSGVTAPEKSLILASTNLEALTLNRMAQQERLKAKVLDPESSITIGAEQFYKRDRVLFTRNSTQVKNGELGEIQSIHGQTIRVQMGDGRRVTINVQDYPHVKGGYSVTVHKAQGMTVDQAFVLVGGGMQDRELTYVEMSRARQQTQIYSDEASAGADLKALIREMQRSREKELAHRVMQKDDAMFQAHVLHSALSL